MRPRLDRRRTKLKNQEWDVYRVFLDLGSIWIYRIYTMFYWIFIGCAVCPLWNPFLNLVQCFIQCFQASKAPCGKRVEALLWQWREVVVEPLLPSSKLASNSSDSLRKVHGQSMAMLTPDLTCSRPVFELPFQCSQPESVLEEAHSLRWSRSKHLQTHHICQTAPASCAISMELMALLGKPWQQLKCSTCSTRNRWFHDILCALFKTQSQSRQSPSDPIWPHLFHSSHQNMMKTYKTYHKTYHKTSKQPLWKSLPLHFNDLPQNPRESTRPKQSLRFLRFGGFGAPGDGASCSTAWVGVGAVHLELEDLRRISQVSTFFHAASHSFRNV